MSGYPEGWLDFGRCEKCGATVPRVRYVGGFDLCPQDKSHPAEPHFHVDCWRCGWSWFANTKGGRA